MTAKAFTFTDQQSAQPSPHRRCRRTDRETIEAELVRLRSNRNGFVKSESLRISSPRNKDGQDDNDDERSRVSGGSRIRRWRRRQNNSGERSLVERFRDAARRSKLTELRLVGRRSWWPKFDGKSSKVASLPSSPLSLPKEAVIESKWQRERGSYSHPESEQGELLVNFPDTERKHPSMSMYHQLLDKFGKCEILDTPEAAISHIRIKKLNLPSDGITKLTMHSDEIIVYKSNGNANQQVQSATGLKPEQTSGVNTDLATFDGKEIEQKKGKIGKFPTVAAVASLSASGLGIAVAIILL